MERSVGFAAIFLCCKLHIDVATEMGFPVATHLELHHFTQSLKLRQHILEEFKKVPVRIALIVFETYVGVVFVSVTLIDDKTGIHAREQERGADGRVRVSAGTSFTKSTSTGLEKE